MEHLAFNATDNYSNHDIVRFLESIGAEFGACQNAYTSCDETVYELVGPIANLCLPPLQTPSTSPPFLLLPSSW